MTTERLIWLDCLRLLAGVSMVALHSTADPAGRPWPDYDVVERIAPLMLRAVIYIARTELFLIISIFLLLMALERRPRSYRETLLEQARRLLVPFLFWTLFYAFYGLVKAGAFQYVPSALNQLGDPAAWVGFLLLGDVKYHMHFLPTLFGLVLMYPLYRLAVRWPVLGLAILACLLLRREVDSWLYAQFWGEDILPYLLRMVKILTYVGYGLFAGAMFGIWQRLPQKGRGRGFLVIAVLGVLLFLFKLDATWQTIQTGRWAFDHTLGYWADFLMPTLLFAGCLLVGHKRWPRLISQIAPFSFGIYLCHPIFLDLCEIALLETSLSPFSQVICKIGITLPLTSAFVVFLSRRRVLAWTVGLGPLPLPATRRPQIKEVH